MIVKKVAKNGALKQLVFPLAIMATFLFLMSFAASQDGGQDDIIEPAAHSASTTMNPNLIIADTFFNFTVDVCNNGPDIVDEFRIYNNTLFDGFLGNDEEGWEKTRSIAKKFFLYIAMSPADQLEGGECEDFSFSAISPSKLACELNWSFETRDLADVWHAVNGTMKVDGDAPIITKVIGEPKFSNSNDEWGQPIWWITQNTGISLSAVEGGGCPNPTGIKKCEYRYFVNDVLVKDWTVWSPEDFQFEFPEDSEHFLEVRCIDNAGNIGYLNETDIVETVPPNTTKRLIEPSYSLQTPNGLVEWIDTESRVELVAVDPEPHPSGVEKMWYINLLQSEDETPCRNPGQACKPVMPSPYGENAECIELAQDFCDETREEQQFESWEACVEAVVHEECDVDDGWHLYTGQFSKPEESCHILQYFSVDKLGNAEEMKTNCFFVDKTPPEPDKTVGEPSVIKDDELEELGNGEASWATDVVLSGLYSGKLVIPDDPAPGDFAGVDSFFDVFVELDDIASLTYDRQVVSFDKGWSPLVVLGIDADGDGTFEAKPLEWEAALSAGTPDASLLGDDSFVQCEDQLPIEILELSLVSVNAYGTFQCYTPNVAGTGYESVYQPLSYFQSNSVGRVEPTDDVLLVKLMLGGNPALQDNEVAYVDNVKLNGAPLIDDPLTYVTPETEITFNCIDPEPHPSGSKELCFRVSYDLADDGFVTDEYCNKYEGAIEPKGEDEKWCCVPETEEEEDSFVFNFNENEQSLHDLEYFCRDNVDKEGKPEIQFYKVEETPPIIIKTVIGPQVGTCPPQNENDECIIDGVTNISVDAWDPQPHPVNDVTCDWRYRVIGGEGSGSGGQTGVTPPFVIQFPEESTHELTIVCRDALGNEVTDVETFKVDKTPPVTVKDYLGPFFSDDTGGPEWINSNTLVKLTATDPPPHPSGVNVTYWRNRIVDDRSCTNDAACQLLTCEPQLDSLSGEGISTQCSGSGCTQQCEPFNLYTGPFNKPEESCHLIEFYSTDLVQKKEVVKKQCVFVDNTPPRGIKSVGTPSVFTGENGDLQSDVQLSQGGSGSIDWYVNQSTPISLDCIDEPPHPVDHETLCYRVSFEDGGLDDLTEKYCNEEALQDGWCCRDVAGEELVTINFSEDSIHNLEFFCKDALGNTNEPDLEYFAVDTVPPSITKTVVGPQLGTCPPLDAGDECYIDGVTKIHVEAVDPDPHPVDKVTCDWSYKVVDGEGGSGGEEGLTPPFDITFPEESTHELTIVCRDALGNEVTDVETFKVDKTPPTTVKRYGEPFVSNELYDWINSATPIYLTATDNKAGVKSVHWRTTLLDDVSDDACVAECGQFSGGETLFLWNNSNQATFNIKEDSCHLIEYYSIDNVDKTENVKKQCVFVDNQAPGGVKTVGQPSIEGDGDPIDWYVNLETPISLSCSDPLPHPVDNEQLCFKVSFDDEELSYITGEYCGEEALQDGWCCPTGGDESPVNSWKLNFKEESLHNLEFFCKDELGNSNNPDVEFFAVDVTPPEIKKTVIGPQVGTCPPQNENDECIIDGVTNISVDAWDPQPHPVNNVTCDWSYRVIGGEGSGGQTGVTPPFVIQFPEESTHELTIVCRDALGNEVTDVETFKVDKTPPITTKEYVGPLFVNESGEWISSATNVTLSAYDPEPHPSGVDRTLWRNTLVADQLCWDDELCQEGTGSLDWNLYEDPFSKTEQSCHLIEYFSVDNVEKTELVKKQCAFVDNTPPTPAKTVGDPKSVWYGLDAQFYDLAGRCWNESAENGLDCWKVTQLTPITLDCADPQPHPVGHSTACFNVELDGEDVTDVYCDRFEGDVQEDDGFCCMTENQAPATLYFGEESEHNLEFYCEDALGNQGPVDEEKFKVEGKSFRIPLHKKWNLISVPFVLFNSTPNDVFGDVNQNISIVLGYDGISWYFYTPDGKDNDNLGSIEPGWGYWVFAKNDTSLLIGGSLFNPAVTPPSRPLVPGWNLIGYYGTEWQDFTALNDEELNNLFCNEEDADEVFSGPVYCTLNSLVDTQEGFPRWSSVWGYRNCALTDTKWVPLHTCGSVDTMFAGKGYWLEVDVADLYAPATTCLWNEDISCISSTAEYWP